MPNFSAIEEAVTGWLRLFEQPRARRITLAVALAVFLIGLTLAIRAFPVSLSSLRLQPVLSSLLIGLPATMAALAADFILQARFAGAQVSVARALEVVIVGSAANVLPVPGGAAIRVTAIKSRGGSLRKAAYAVLLFPGQALGIALIYAGGWLLADFDRTIGAFVLGVGLPPAIVCSALIYRLAVKPSAGLVISTVAVKVVQMLLTSVLVHWSFGALGIP